ncbi:MAG: PhoH family protein [Burkholderiaceae bacterium]
MSSNPQSSSVFTPEPLDNRRLANVCGALDENLRLIERSLNVRIQRRANEFLIEGGGPDTARAHRLLERVYARADDPLNAEDLQLALIDSRSSDPERADDDASPPLRTRRSDLQGRTPRQREYLRSILSSDVTFGVGPAGTGKTYLAVACAVDALERDAVKRIILTRPAVEAGERLGFLPGDLAQKVDPYLRPLYDALYDLLGTERTNKCFERQEIEIAPLAYMRGRTLNHAFIILDEAQNTTPEQMKMFLTRMGFGSRMVITGDLSQIDLPRGQPSGLVQAVKLLARVRGISISEFSSADVVRHPLVARIVEAYARMEQRNREAAERADQTRDAEPHGGSASRKKAQAGRPDEARERRPTPARGRSGSRDGPH